MGATIIVQNDAGTVADANSYIDLDFANSYFAQVSNTVWAGLTDDQKTSAIILAYRWLESRPTPVGQILTNTQVSKWPRQNFTTSGGRLISGIPLDLQKAQAELALISTTESLFPRISYSQTGREASELSTTVGPVSRTQRFATGSEGGGFVTVKEFPVVTAYLKDLVAGSTILLSRG